MKLKILLSIFLLSAQLLYAINPCIEGGPYEGDWSGWQTEKPIEVIFGGALEFNSRTLPFETDEKYVPDYFSAEIIDSVEVKIKVDTYDCSDPSISKRYGSASLRIEGKWETSPTKKIGTHTYNFLTRSITKDADGNEEIGEWEVFDTLSLTFIDLVSVSYTGPAPKLNEALIDSEIQIVTNPPGYESMVSVDVINGELIYEYEGEGGDGGDGITLSKASAESNESEEEGADDSVEITIEAKPVEIYGTLGSKTLVTLVDLAYCEDLIRSLTSGELIEAREFDEFKYSPKKSFISSNREEIEKQRDELLAQHEEGKYRPRYYINSRTVNVCGISFQTFYIKQINHGAGGIGFRRPDIRTYNYTFTSLSDSFKYTVPLSAYFFNEAYSSGITEQVSFSSNSAGTKSKSRFSEEGNLGGTYVDNEILTADLSSRLFCVDFKTDEREDFTIEYLVRAGSRTTKKYTANVRYIDLEFLSDNILIATNQDGSFEQELDQLFVEVPDNGIPLSVTGNTSSMVLSEYNLSGNAFQGEIVTVSTNQLSANLNFHYMDLTSNKIKFAGSDALNVDLYDFVIIDEEFKPYVTFELNNPSSSILLNNSSLFIGSEGGVSNITVRFSIPGVYGEIVEELELSYESLTFKNDKFNILQSLKSVDLSTLLTTNSPSEDINWWYDCGADDCGLYLDQNTLHFGEFEGRVQVFAEHDGIQTSAYLYVENLTKDTDLVKLAINSKTSFDIRNYISESNIFIDNLMSINFEEASYSWGDTFEINQSEAGYLTVELSTDPFVLDSTIEIKIAIQSILPKAEEFVLYFIENEILDLKELLVTSDIYTNEGVVFNIISGSGIGEINEDLLTYLSLGELNISATFNTKVYYINIKLKGTEVTTLSSTEFVAVGETLNSRNYIDNSGIPYVLELYNSNKTVNSVDGQFTFSQTGAYKTRIITNPGSPGEQTVELNLTFEVVDLSFSQTSFEIIPGSGFVLNLAEYLSSEVRNDLDYDYSSSRHSGDGLTLTNTSYWENGRHKINVHLKTPGGVVIVSKQVIVDLVQVHFKKNEIHEYVTKTDGIVDLSKYLSFENSSLQFTVNTLDGAAFSLVTDSPRIDFSQVEGEYVVEATYTGTGLGIIRDRISDKINIKIEDVGFYERELIIPFKNNASYDLREYLKIPKSEVDVNVKFSGPDYFKGFEFQEISFDGSYSAKIRRDFWAIDMDEYAESLIAFKQLLDTVKKGRYDAYLNRSRVWEFNGRQTSNYTLNLGYQSDEYGVGTHEIEMFDRKFGRSDKIKLTFFDIVAYSNDLLVPVEKYEIPLIASVDKPFPLYLKCVASDDANSNKFVFDVIWSITNSASSGAHVNPVGKFHSGNKSGLVTVKAALRNHPHIYVERTIPCVEAKFIKSANFLSTLNPTVSISTFYAPTSGLAVFDFGELITSDEDALNRLQILDFNSPTHADFKNTQKLTPGTVVKVQAEINDLVIASDELPVSGIGMVPYASRLVLRGANDSIQVIPRTVSSSVSGPVISWHSTNPRVIKVDENGLVTRASADSLGSAEIYFKYSLANNSIAQLSAKLPIKSVGLDKLIVDGTTVISETDNRFIFLREKRKVKLQAKTSLENYTFTQSALTWSGATKENAETATLNLDQVVSTWKTISVTDGSTIKTIRYRIIDPNFVDCIPRGQSMDMSSLYSFNPHVVPSSKSITSLDTSFLSISGTSLTGLQEGSVGVKMNFQFNDADYPTTAVYILYIEAFPTLKSSVVTKLKGSNKIKYNLYSNITENQFRGKINWTVYKGSEELSVYAGEIIDKLDEGTYNISGSFTNACGINSSISYKLEVEQLEVSVIQSNYEVVYGELFVIPLELSHGDANASFELTYDDRFIDAAYTFEAVRVDAIFGGYTYLTIRYIKDGVSVYTDPIRICVNGDFSFKSSNVKVSADSNENISYSLAHNLNVNQVYFSHNPSTNFYFEFPNTGKQLAHGDVLNVISSDHGLKYHVTTRLDFDNGCYQLSKSFKFDVNFYGALIKDHYVTYNITSQGFTSKVNFDVDTNPVGDTFVFEKLSSDTYSTLSEKVLHLHSTGKSVIRAKVDQSSHDNQTKYSLDYALRHDDFRVFDEKGPFLINDHIINGTNKLTQDLRSLIETNEPNAKYYLQKHGETDIIEVPIAAVPIDPYERADYWLIAKNLSRQGDDALRIVYNPKVTVNDFTMKVCHGVAYPVLAFGGTAPYRLVIESGSAITLDADNPTHAVATNLGKSTVIIKDNQGYGHRVYLEVIESELEFGPWKIREKATFATEGSWELLIDHTLLVSAISSRHLSSSEYSIEELPTLNPVTIQRIGRPAEDCYAPDVIENVTIEGTHFETFVYDNSVNLYEPSASGYRGTFNYVPTSAFKLEYTHEDGTTFNSSAVLDWKQVQYAVGPAVTITVDPSIDPECFTFTKNNFINYFDYNVYPSRFFSEVEISNVSEYIQEINDVYRYLKKVFFTVRYKGIARVVRKTFYFNVLPSESITQPKLDVIKSSSGVTHKNAHNTSSIFLTVGQVDFELVDHHDATGISWSLKGPNTNITRSGTSLSVNLPKEGNYSLKVDMDLGCSSKAISLNLNMGVDSDNDGLVDTWEETINSDISLVNGNTDSDKDNLKDKLEFFLGTDPNKVDTDNDSYKCDDSPPNMSDYQEYQLNLQNSKVEGTDNYYVIVDGNPIVGINPNPNLLDSDGDGISDGWEYYFGYDYNDKEDFILDEDNDGLNNLEEYMYCADPSDEDTDDDGYTDKEEADSGANPNDSSDNGEPPENSFLYGFWLGDSSGSESENYYMTLFNENGELLFGMPGPSKNPIDRNGALVPGTYRAIIDFVGGTNPPSSAGDHIFFGIVPKEDEDGKIGDYIVTSVENSTMTVYREVPDLENGAENANFPVSNTGQPWPTPIIVTFDVVEEAPVDLELESADRFLTGVLDYSEYGSLSEVGLQLINPSTNETYTIDKLSEYHIYNSENEIFSDSEAEAGVSEWSKKKFTQDIVLLKEGQKIRFFTTFNGVGEIEAKVLMNGTEEVSDSYTLIRLDSVGDVLSTIDDILLDASGEGQPSFKPTTTLSKVRSSVSVNGWDFYYKHSISKRNLTSKTFFSFWKHVKSKLRKGVELVTGGAKVLASKATGFMHGFWAGVKDDANSLAELWNLVTHPIDTGKSIYEGFKTLWGLTGAQWITLGETMYSEFLTSAENNLPFVYDPQNVADRIALMAYMQGYLVGFAGEQIIVAMIGAGIVTKIGKIVKVVLEGSKAGKAALKVAMKGQNAAETVVSNVSKAKNSMFRWMSRQITTKDGAGDLKKLLDSIHACR